MAPGDDFSAFMAKGIPERLRNRALRKLWLTNPVLANLDELVEYGEDYTDAATVVENLQTAYRIGKGFLRREEIEAENASAATDDPEVLPASESDQTALDADGSEQLNTTADTETETPESHSYEAKESVAVDEIPALDVSEQPALPRRSRRMVFRVENG